MTIGIYLLRFKNTTKVYIGKSLHIEGRFKDHIKNLTKGNGAKKLQEAFNTFGIPELEILCDCGIDELSELEDLGIQLYDAVLNGFNTLKESGDVPLNCGEEHGCSKYSNEQIEEVFNLLISSIDISFKEISERTLVSTDIISKVSSTKLHHWLEEKYPEKYAILRSIRGTRNPERNSIKDKGIIYPKILSPTGEIFMVENIRKFAREHGLDQGNLGKTLKGIRKTVGGWKLAS